MDLDRLAEEISVSRKTVIADETGFRLIPAPTPA
jgi:DNA-binding XRE family transcriptional regulator